ncbi:MAG TPA: patatin-like phospholipase family protein [Bacillota bacterium]|nr:patatin-like phospholipase family protein [Bacillota bacterium]
MNVGYKRGIGLALGSGSARGLAHIGVLKVLEREQIPINAISGSSMGALIGGLYAAGMPLRELESIALKVTRRAVLAHIDPIPSLKGLVLGKKIEEMLRSFIGNKDFSELRIPMAIVATDILTGEELVLKDKGDVVNAIRASISVPVVFVPVRAGDRILVDGGVVNPVPVDAVTLLDPRAIPVAVSVIPKVEHKQAERPTTVDILLNTFDIMQHKLYEANKSLAKIVIEPNVSFASGIEFWKAGQIIECGEQAARDRIPAIRRALKPFSFFSVFGRS